MSIPPDINSIFDINENVDELGKEIDMDISDDDIDFILDATDGVGHVWEGVEDDDNTMSEGSNEAKRMKTYHIPVEEYEKWIKNLERAGLSYVRHDRQRKLGGNRKLYQWNERWYCHRYGTYKSIAGKNPNKKSRLAQKETKKCGCKSYIHVKLPFYSSTVILHHHYKHNNHYPGRLSDLYTLPLSENIRHFIQQRVLEGLDSISIQRLLRFRAVELQDRVLKECNDSNSNIQTCNIQKLRDALITRDDIYTIVHKTMKTLAYIDENVMISLAKWKEKLIIAGGNCLFKRNDMSDEIGFIFAFQTKEQKELTNSSRVLCLDGTHGLNGYGYQLFSLLMRHPATGHGYPIAFLISEFKRTITLKEWLNFLKQEHEEWCPDIFMVDDAGEEIKAVKECFPDSSVFLCHFHVLRSWRRKLGHKHGSNIEPHKEIIWNDLWQLLKTEGWSDAEAQEQIVCTINKWREMGIETVRKFADYFERWWMPQYEMWMTCARGIAREKMDTNNLIEAFHHKLKYTYMRGRPSRRLDGEVYLLVEIVLRDINFDNFLSELKIGRMNPRQRQQRIREIVGTKFINEKDVYKLQQNVWIVRSMTNDDVEYSVRRRDSSDDELDVSLYVCTCRDFKTRQLPCKHIFAVLSQVRTYENNTDNMEAQPLSIVESPISPNIINTNNDKNGEILKLQEVLSSITTEWRDKSVEDIRSLRTTLTQAIQMERARIARIDIVPANNNEVISSQTATNIKFRKQILF